jgi:hypothetical protein
MPVAPARPASVLAEQMAPSPSRPRELLDELAAQPPVIRRKAR